MHKKESREKIKTLKQNQISQEENEIKNQNTKRKKK